MKRFYTFIFLISCFLISILSMNLVNAQGTNVSILHGWNGTDYVPLEVDSDGKLKTTLNLNELTSINPDADNIRSIGTSSLRWRNLFLSGNLYGNGTGYFNSVNVTDDVCITGGNCLSSTISSSLSWAEVTNGTLYLSSNPFGFYNITDFDIGDYYTSAQIEGFNYYNATDFDISDYRTLTNLTFVGNGSFTTDVCISGGNCLSNVGGSGLSWAEVTNGTLYLSSNPFSFVNTTTASDLNNLITLSGANITDDGTYLLATGDTATGNYTFDTSTFFIDSSNNRVGIGTASPDYLLEVAGNPEDPFVSAVFGNNNAQGYGGLGVYGENQSHIRFWLDDSATGNPDWQIRAGEALGEDTLQIYSWTHADNLITFDGSTGNVGVGIDSPTAKFQVGSAGSAANIGYDIGASKIGAGTSIYSYGPICAGNSAGDCSGTGGVVINTNSIDLQGNDIINVHEISAPSDSAMPNIVLDSSSSGDDWTSQGAYISLGESGDLGSASTHLTYRGDGYGFVGAGTVTNAEPAGGFWRFAYSTADTYTDNAVTIANTANPGLTVGNGATGYLQVGSTGWYDDGTYFSPLGNRHFYVRSNVPTSYIYSPNIYLGSTSGTTVHLRDNDISADGYFFDGSSGKITVNTVDPPYTINGKPWATYMAGMVGLKEEVTDSINLETYSEKDQGFIYVIDFNNQEEGSDLWLFGEAINIHGKTYTDENGKEYPTTIEEVFDKLVVILSPSFNGNVWYEKVPEEKKLIIYGSHAGEVSYRFTGERFDGLSIDNARNPNEDGFVEGLNLDKLLKKP